MTINRNIPVLLGALCCLAPMRLIAADESCPDLKGKSTADHLEYLRGDRSKLSAKCVVAAIGYVDAKRYAPASAVLIQYLDYQDPDSKGQVGKRAMVVYAYPAVDALCSLGKLVVPELIAVISNPDVTDLVRRNAGWAIFLMYGAGNPAGIAVFVDAAHAQTDPTASNRLMDQARWFADRCLVAVRNDCENAVLRQEP
jgi:hypothetical protein